MAAWGHDLERGIDHRLEETEDLEGRLALIYAATKLAASQVPGGAKAVEYTAMNIVLLPVLQSMWPAIFGAPSDSFAVMLPPMLGPPLVAAGLAEPGPGTGPYIPVRRDLTVERFKQASSRNRERLREQQAWTCRFAAIERTVLPTEPSLVHAAKVSPHIFASWLRDVNAIWLVRADCATGPGLFVVTGARDGVHLDDRILLAWLVPLAPSA